MPQQQQEYSLTTAFRMKADAEDLRNRRELVRAKQSRNRANQASIGEWHRRISSAHGVEIPFPERRTH